MCEQIENDDDVELSNTASVYNGSHDVCNNVPMIQQVDCAYSHLFLLPLQNHYHCSQACVYKSAIITNQNALLQV